MKTSDNLRIATKTDMELLTILVAKAAGVSPSKLLVDAMDLLANWINSK